MPLEAKIERISEDLEKLKTRFELHSSKEQGQNEKIVEGFDRINRALFGEVDSRGNLITKGTMAKMDELYTEFVQKRGVWKQITNFIMVGSALGILWTAIAYLIKRP